MMCDGLCLLPAAGAANSSQAVVDGLAGADVQQFAAPTAENDSADVSDDDAASDSGSNFSDLVQDDPLKLLDPTNDDSDQGGSN